LTKKGFENTTGEWVRCAVDDVKTALAELRIGRPLAGTRHETFPMRAEQPKPSRRPMPTSIPSGRKTCTPYRAFVERQNALRQAFAAYQLARKLGARRVLVVTFKPAVEDAWQSDLESHVDFEGWQYTRANSGCDPTGVSVRTPLVYFGSFQDLLGRDERRHIKPRTSGCIR
jgi:hypothetical protein